MSESSAKHEALTILRLLTSEKNPRTSTSPRADLASSQEVLAGKYQELATLLANHYAERKTVARLQKVNLIARKTAHGPSRSRQDYHDEPVRRRHRKSENKLKRADIPQDGLTSSGLDRETESDFNLKKLQHSQNKSKKVSFSDVEFVRSTDDDCSSNTSDTEIIRRILRSPRRVTTETKDGTSRVVGRGKSYHTGKKQMSKRKHPLKVKKSFEDSPKKTSNGSSKRETPESPREKKEFQPTDTKLSSSSNPDVLSWLKDKNKCLRKQRRSERKKERLEKLAEQKAVEEKTRRLAESEDKVAQWMKLKREESVIKRKVERKVRGELKLRESLSPRTLEGASNEITSSQLKMSVRQNKSEANSKNKPKIVSQPSDHDAPHQSSLEGRHHLVQDLAAERLQAEEKRQRREAEKKQKRVLKDSQTVKDTEKTFTQPPVSTSAKTTAKDRVTKPDSETKKNSSGDSRRNRPSSNPFKGMTYDEWMRQKQDDHRKWAKEAKKQVGDPELDNLIPVLARRRIEQIKIRATRVDSGLRRSRDPPDDRKEKPRTPNGVRPYTWATPPTVPTDKKRTTKSSPYTKSKKIDKEFDSAGAKQNITSPMPDVINFERSDDQGCEHDKNAPCQSPKASQSGESKDTYADQSESKDTYTDQSEQNAHKIKLSSTNDCNQKPNEESNPLETDVIFMTQPTV